MDIDVLKISTVALVALAALLKLLSEVFNFKWSNFREHTKRLEIIDLANKRAEFWDQVLKIQLACAAPGEDEPNRAKVRAFQATQRIQSQADNQLQQLAWKSSTRKKSSGFRHLKS